MNQMPPEIRRVSEAVAESIRENPLGAALLGMGLVWLVSSRTGAPEVVGRALHTAGDALSAGGTTVGRAAARAGASIADGAASVGAFVGETTEAAADAIQGQAVRLGEATRSAVADLSDISDDVANRASDASRQAAREWRRAASPAASSAIGGLDAGRQWLSRTLENQPLILAAGALAAGAAIAATLPIMAAEKRAFGATAREAVDAAAGMARQGMAAAGDVAEDMTKAAQEEAARQGLTPGQLSQQAGELADKARAVARDTAGKLL